MEQNEYHWILIILLVFAIIMVLIPKTDTIIIVKPVQVHEHNSHIIVKPVHEHNFHIHKFGFYCTNKEYNHMFSTFEPECGFAKDYSKEHGGLLKLNGRWINIYWLERQHFTKKETTEVQK